MRGANDKQKRFMRLRWRAALPRELHKHVQRDTPSPARSTGRLAGVARGPAAGARARSGAHGVRRARDAGL
eukprot:15357163-Alexandrium_andersonii.AAC.1